MITANRYHDISVGHRVHGHESKCSNMHGHNYRVHFEVVPELGQLDLVGRVLDFSVIKSRLCEWLEEKWDHKFLAWEHDPVMDEISRLIPNGYNASEASRVFRDSFVWVPFNPTAENMAEYLVEKIGPSELAGTGCILQKVIIEETRKCSCAYTRSD